MCSRYARTRAITRKEKSIWSRLKASTNVIKEMYREPEINTNIAASDAVNNLIRTAWSMSQSIQRLSCGPRTNSATDAPAGLAISENLQGTFSRQPILQQAAIPVLAPAQHWPCCRC